MEKEFRLDSTLDKSQPGIVGKVDGMARDFMTRYYILASAVIIVLSIVVVWLLFRGWSEKFMPTATLRMQQRDGLGESMTTPPVSGQQLLSSGECDGRKAIGDDAWAWMYGVAKENMSAKPKDDNDFSRVLSGY